jgi:hypothetical protein
VSVHLLNVALGLIPTLILGASISAGAGGLKPAAPRIDDRAHGRMFVFVYGLWALTLAMWNWMRSAPVWWIALWLVMGALALGAAFALRSRPEASS